MIKNKAEKSNNLTFLIAAAMAVFLFYYSYRYVFRYNSEVTSPTYSSTPLSFQIVKYILMAGLSINIFICIRRYKINGKFNLPLVLIFLILLQGFYGFLTTYSSNSLILICCAMPTFLVMLVKGRISCTIIEKVCKIFLCFTILYELLQIALFWSFGRLPALGYDSGYITDVRFGGPWDDPNGFALMLSFLIPYVFCKYKRFEKFLIGSLLLVFLILTWSLTGIAAFLGACVVYFLINLFFRRDLSSVKKITIVLASIIFLLLIFAIVNSLFSEQLKVFLERKMGSIEGHMESWDFKDIGLGTLWGIEPIIKNAESSIAALLYQGGVIHVVLFYSLCILAVFKAFKNIRTAEKNGINTSMYKGIFFYQVAFLFGSLNLPYVYMFANMGVFMIFLLLSFSPVYFFRGSGHKGDK